MDIDVKTDAGVELGGVSGGLVDTSHPSASENVGDGDCPDLTIDIDKLPAGTKQIVITIMP